MRTLDEEIADRLKQAVESGELSAAQSYGKPFDLNSGWGKRLEALRRGLRQMSRLRFCGKGVRQ